MTDALVSGRNQLPGVVKSINDGKVMSKITIDVLGHSLTAVIVNDSVSTMDIHEQDQVKVLFKATSVMILKEDTSAISGRNKIPVIIKKIEKGMVVSQITLDFNGLDLSAIIVTDSVDDLEIKEGDHVFALIKSTSVMIMKP